MGVFGSIALFLLLIVLCSISVVRRLLGHIRTHIRAEELFGNFLETMTAYMEWRVQNPGVYIGLSPQGTQLVWNNIHAYLIWRAYAKKIGRYPESNEALLDALYELLNDLPPKSPETQPAPAGCFLYLSHRTLVKKMYTVRHSSKSLRKIDFRCSCLATLTYTYNHV